MISIPLLAAFGAAFFSSAKDASSKAMSFSLSGAASSVGSFVFALPFYFLVILYLFVFDREMLTVHPGFWGLVLLRALSDAAGESCKMYAFRYGDLSTVTILLSLMPIGTVLLSPLVTNDPFHFSGLLGAGLVVMGSLVAVLQGVPSRKGIVLALAAVTFMSLNHCLDRLAVHTAAPIVSGGAMTLFAALFSAPLFFFDGKLSEFRSGFWPLALRGVFEILFMSVKLYALVTLDAPTVMLILRLALPLNLLVGFLVFKEKGMPRKALACLLILIGVWVGV